MQEQEIKMKKRNRELANSIIEEGLAEHKRFRVLNCQLTTVH